MIPNPMLMFAVLVAFVLNGFYWNAHGSNAADTRWTAKITAENLKATQEARAKERMWQGVVNGTVKNMEAQRAAVQRNLNIALDGLRDRPERPAGVSEAPRTGCQGANGAELSGEDGRFLEGEAARANRHRAALEACYAYADTVTK